MHLIYQSIDGKELPGANKVVLDRSSLKSPLKENQSIETFTSSDFIND